MNANSTATHSFPVAFAIQCFGIVGTVALKDTYAGGGNTEFMVIPFVATPTQYRIRAGTGPNGLMLFWMAAGV